MDNKAIDYNEPVDNAQSWAALLEEMRDEYLMSEELSEDEKRFLDDLEATPEQEWQPITCTGRPISETIIEEREVR